MAYMDIFGLEEKTRYGEVDATSENAGDPFGIMPPKKPAPVPEEVVEEIVEEEVAEEEVKEEEENPEEEKEEEPKNDDATVG